MTVNYHVGDTRDLVRTLPDGSVSLVASSPPFIALRSYLPDDHPAKHAEIGTEPDPATFVDCLLELVHEWGRVLAPWGSIAIELGDSYSGSGGAGGDYNPGGLRDGQNRFRAGRIQPAIPGAGTRPGWPRPKCMALVPQAFAMSLAYGRNVLRGPMPAHDVLEWIDALRATGQTAEHALATVGGWVAEHGAARTFDPWLVRNMIVWHRPNPAVGQLGDKFRPSTSYITVATRSSARWFDLTAVRTPYDGAPPIGGSANSRQASGDVRGRGGHRAALAPVSNASGAPPLDAWFDLETDDGHDLWTITTQPSKLAHYAMWPPKLADRIVRSMCPLEVCATCGEPRRRIELTGLVPSRVQRVGIASASRGISGGDSGNPDKLRPVRSTSGTAGWTDCGHGTYRPGVVLDPFAGTGTTMAVAHLRGRDAIGFDLDERNRGLYGRRFDEVRRALFGTRPEVHGQQDLFGSVTV